MTNIYFSLASLLKYTVTLDMHQRDPCTARYAERTLFRLVHPTWRNFKTSQNNARVVNCTRSSQIGIGQYYQISASSTMTSLSM